MNTIEIIRFVDYGRWDEGTFGILRFNNFSCYTVERPWVNNEPFISCIPLGIYDLEYYYSPKFGESAIIYGNSVSKFPSNYYKRSGILIHVANISSDVQGCIGLGNRMGIIRNKIAVLNSKKTISNFLELINTNNMYKLEISYNESGNLNEL
jgi:hypothetical protein